MVAGMCAQPGSRFVRPKREIVRPRTWPGNMVHHAEPVRRFGKISSVSGVPALSRMELGVPLYKADRRGETKPCATGAVTMRALDVTPYGSTDRSLPQNHCADDHLACNHWDTSGDRKGVSLASCNAIECATAQMAKLVPQPQEAVALGLCTLKEEPIRSSTKSISEPERYCSETGSTRTRAPARSIRRSSGSEARTRSNL